MIPFLRSLEKCFHICQIVISYPTRMYSVKRFFNHDKPLPLLRLVMDFSSRRNCSLLFLSTVIPHLPSRSQ